MKKLLIFITAALLLAGCASPGGEKTSPQPEYTAYKDVAERGVWLSFSEINSMLKNENGFKAEFLKAVQKCGELGITEMYIHVRAYCDSLYKSEIFPLVSGAENYDFDIFGYITDVCREKGIAVHAWINPYRVLSSSEDIEKVPQNSPAYVWLHDSDPANDRNVVRMNGIYLDPSSSEVQRLIISGVKEICEKYSVAGVHIDDYFYPTADSAFDAESYAAYREKTENALTLEDWRRSNVNSMITGCYNAVKAENNSLVFTVSPMASIEKNRDELFCDVEELIKEGTVDCIIPQLYFGYDYPDDNFKFDTLLKKWEELASLNRNVKLKIGLATYKIGTDAAPDRDEWQNGTAVIEKQVSECTANGSVAGYVFFSYTSLAANNFVF